ncbi:hypothetical protein VOLCADRAFT_93312, partial [Volvox carteri f. nagariensis]
RKIFANVTERVMSTKQTYRPCGLFFSFLEPLQLLQTKAYDYSLLSKQLQTQQVAAQPPRRPQRFLRIDSLPQELAMVYTAYAAALRHSALQHYISNVSGHLAEAAAAPAGSDGAVADADSGETAATAAAASRVQPALTAAVAGLRRAAGVYDFLAENLLPALRGAGALAAGDRPLELLPAAALCMKQLCLAEAQALVAVAAEVKGMSPGTQRALHAGAVRFEGFGGCVSLYRAAAAAAQALAAAAPSGLPLSDRLTHRLLPAAVAIHGARAQLCVARERQIALELGEAEAACEECLRLLESASRYLDRRCDSESPGLEFVQALFIKIQATTSGINDIKVTASQPVGKSADRAACTALRSAVQRDRLAVTFQPLPKHPPDAVANAAVRVAPDVFQPEPVLPPAPPADVQARSGCNIM